MGEIGLHLERGGGGEDAEAWGERRFSRDVEDRRFIRSHSLELQGYSVDTSNQ